MPIIKIEGKAFAFPSQCMSLTPINNSYETFFVIINPLFRSYIDKVSANICFKSSDGISCFKNICNITQTHLYAP